MAAGSQPQAWQSAGRARQQRLRHRSRLADGAGTIYSSGQAARGERCPNSLPGLFAAIRRPRRQLEGEKKSQHLHSAEATLEMRKSPLVLISAFCKQWKLFLLLISALSPPGTPHSFRRSLPCSSLALFMAELEEFIVLWKLCCHGNSGTLNFNCKAQYMFMKIINKNANRDDFITLVVSFLLWYLFSCLSHSCYFAEKGCTGAEFF